MDPIEDIIKNQHLMNDVLNSNRMKNSTDRSKQGVNDSTDRITIPDGKKLNDKLIFRNQTTNLQNRKCVNQRTSVDVTQQIGSIPNITSIDGESPCNYFEGY